MKKFSVRHSNKGVVSLIILYIICVNLLNFSFNLDFRSKNDISLNKTSYILENYLYKLENIFDPNFHKSNMTKNDLVDLYMKSEIEVNGKISSQYVTNVAKINENQFKIDVLLNKIKNPAVLLKYENNKFNVKKINAFNLNELQEIVINNLVGVLEHYDGEKDFKYENLKVKKINAIYEIKSDNLSAIEKNIAKEIDLSRIKMNFIIFSTITFIFFGFISLISRYEEIKTNAIYDFLAKTPFEIYMMFLLFSERVVYFLGEVFRYVSREFYNQAIYYVFINVISIAIILTVIFYAFYVAMITKSIYFEGLNSFVLKKSIIYRFATSIYNYFARKFRYFIGDNITNMIIWIILFIFILLVGVVLIRRIDLIIIWFILLAVFYNFLSKIINDFKKIENITSEISDGDFEVKIDEDKTYFKKIAHNLNTIHAALNTAVEKELKSERMKTNLITNVSHDLKTPLTSIINYADLALNTKSKPEDRDKYNQIIYDKSIKLKKIIEGLFEVSKVTSNNVEVNKKNINIVEMINQMIGEWMDEFCKKDISIVFIPRTENFMIEIDPEHMFRVFDNVFSNINKYAQESTRVYIDIENSNSTKIIVKNISKYPLNISADELKERFVRGDESRNTEGSGLGLAIASSLVEIQGGQFELEIDGDLFKVIITI
ncbi:sensor histidine kinase [Helcococcus ovis]|uniref:sensor histidine kinase n=1 Tax=Helcococcus ovis TaxID=72026 RepID=UPI0038BC27D2